LDVDNDVNDLHLKPSDPNDAMECNRWKEMMRGNWSDSSSVML